MQLRDKIEFLLFLSFSKIFAILKLNKTRKFAKVFSRFIFYFVPIRKGTVLSNLTKAFPDYDREKILEIAKENYHNITLTFFELMYFPYLRKEELLNLVECKNVDMAIQKHGEGKGVIVITGHYGSWEIGAAWLGLRIGMPLHVIAKPQRNEYVTKWINNARERFGNKIVPLGVSIREIYSVIKNGGLIGVVGDQRGHKEAIRVKFFGQSTAVYPGTAQIALKTQCPVIAAFVERKPDLNYELFFYQINTKNISGTAEEQIEEINQKYFELLERHVRVHPEQWFWMHKIWKY